jgi:hypothetical protein
MAVIISGKQFGCGGRLMMKARFSICWCNDDATGAPP